MVLALLLHLFHGEAPFDEEAFGSFTRHKLKQLPTSWDLWLASEWKQLDAHQQQSFFGAPYHAAPGATMLCAARNTPMICDGSIQACRSRAPLRSNV
jgi:hypothetical protein